MSRDISNKELCHDNLGDQFEKELSSYDTSRRVEVLVNKFLGADQGGLIGKSVLEVGCGLGFFTEALSRAGAQVTAIDLGPGLVERTKDRVPSARVLLGDALSLRDTLGDETFDVVLSSECVEHTPDPLEAVTQMVSVLRPQGLLSLSTPNLLWWPIVFAATKVKIRAFDGLENFVSPKALRQRVLKSGAEVLRHEGLHLFPFQFGWHGLSRSLDDRAQFLSGLMINQCLLARKL